MREETKMKKTLILIAGLFCLLPLTQSHANELEYKIGYESIPGKFFTPIYKEHYTWTGAAWGGSASTYTQHEQSVNYSVLFFRVSKSFPLTRSFRAEFETGMGFAKDGLKKDWSVNGSTNAATDLTADFPAQWSWATYPPNENYDWFYNVNHDIWIIPLTAKISYRPAQKFLQRESRFKPRFAAGFGVYLVGMKTEEIYGRKYFDYGGGYGPGEIDISGHNKYYTSPLDIVIPVFQLETGFLYDFNNTIAMGFNLGASYLKGRDETDKDTYNGTITNSVLRDGYSLGGLAYNMSLSLNFSFETDGNSVKASRPQNLSESQEKELKKKYWTKAVREYNKANYEKAISYWEKILDMDPGHKASLQKIEQAQKMMKNYE